MATNTNIAMDIDPLSAYECPPYDYQLPNSTYPPTYPYKNEFNYPNNQFTQNQANTNQNIPTETENCQKNNHNEQAHDHNEQEHNHNDPGYNDNGLENNDNAPNNEEVDIKPDITKKQKKRGKQSNYWNKKIADKDFAFYGCSVCNIAYRELNDLDQHVLIHTNRMTSYDLRLQNLKKRKKMKKEKKKMKKEAKVKKEVQEVKEFEIEIKPEDGYIGNEKTTDYNKDNEIGQNITQNNDSGHNEQGDNKLGNNEKIQNKMETENNENNPTNAENEKNFINVYKCFGCNKQFALSYYLRIHVRSHTDEKPYKCSYCGLSFITASKRGRHYKRVHLNTRHQCRICYRFFNRFELLVAHFDKKHAEDKLEGEPYDYNAILPYLKELEAELSQEPDKKPKVEDPWFPEKCPETEETKPAQDIQVVQDVAPKVEVEVEEKVIIPSSYEFETSFEEENIMIEEVKVDVDVEVDVKMEPQTDTQDETEPEANQDEVKDEKDSNQSDDDYFPTDSWAASPPPPPKTPPRAACQICNKTFSSNSYLSVHMRTHTGEKPFPCYICGRGFITAGKMHRHVLTHDESWTGENGIKPDGEDIKTELNCDDEQTKKTKVKEAKAKLLKKQSAIGKKYKKRAHMCEFCQKRFLHIETLQVHKKSHEGESIVLKCSFCLEPQNDAETLKEHEATHTGPKPYLCTICGKTYKKRETMVYHRKDHKSIGTYICDICSKKFRSQTKLQRHIISHSTEKFILRYECPVCAHMFHTRYHVQMHLNTHQKEGLIQEENRAAVLAMVLQNARKIPKTADATPTDQNIQTDERSRICNICGQIFQHFYYLEEHLKTHGSKIAIENIEKPEEKKYTCTVCSKSFKLHYYLKLHNFTHTKEKPFICQQCGKGFITKGKLKRHLETHQGLKKYQCHICYKFFTRPSYLRIHVRTIHGTQDYIFRDYNFSAE